MAEIEANKSGISDTKARSKLNISTANTIAAIGALNIDAIAAAVAHPIKSKRVFALIWNTCEILDPMAEATVKAGPCNPTDPPKPAVIGATIKGA